MVRDLEGSSLQACSIERAPGVFIATCQSDCQLEDIDGCLKQAT